MRYHLFYWGGVQNDSLASKFLGTADQDFWFTSKQDRQDFKDKLTKFSRSNNRIVAFSEHDGSAAEHRTVAVMVFIYDGVEYPLEHDFGVGYPSDSAEYMFNEGNYSCDCNRALFLREIYPDAVWDECCGEMIVMKSFHVELRSVSAVGDFHD